jgi:hypothetical protein
VGSLAVEGGGELIEARLLLQEVLGSGRSMPDTWVTDYSGGMTCNLRARKHTCAVNSSSVHQFLYRRTFLPRTKSFWRRCRTADAGVITGHYTDAHNVTHSFVRRPSGEFTAFDAPGASSAAASGYLLTASTMRELSRGATRARTA